MKKLHSFFCAVVMMIVFLAALFGYGLFSVEEMSSLSLFNVGYDVIAMLLSVVLFVCCILDGTMKDAGRRRFMFLIFCNFLAMVLDSTSYFLEGNAALRNIHNTGMAVIFVLDYVVYYMLLEYLVTSLELQREKVVKALLIVFGIIAVVSGVVALFNIRYPIYYLVDESGSYSRLPLYILNTLFKFLISLAIFVILIIYRKKLKRYQIIAVACYAVGLDVLVLCCQIDGLYVEYAVILLLLLIMYIILNVENGTLNALTKKELDTAKTIQASILPNLFPDYVDVPEFEIFALMTPAKEVGGDFYDFFMLDEKRFAFLIGEVSSHDVGGALFMAVAKSMINMGAQLGGTPADVLEKVNKRIVSSDYSAMSAKVWLAFLDISTGHLIYASAGVPRIYVQDQEVEGIFREENFRVVPPVGETMEPGYQNAEADLVPGDRIYLYTSGIPSSGRQDGEVFGEDRLLSTLNENLEKNNETLCGTVQETIDAFRGDLPQHDDITMLSFTFKKAKTEPAEVEA